jgi:TDG/mug DNA glycosylase family protein
VIEGLMPSNRTLPDRLCPGLDVVFVGINPGEYSVLAGHYYARPTNQFWKLLSQSGLVRQELTCRDDSCLLDLGIGLTDVVKRATQSANQLRAADFRKGAPRLLAKLQKVRPRAVAFNGKMGYTRFRHAQENFVGHSVRLGLQAERLAGARVFVLPSTSPANARLPYATKLRYFRQLARWVRKHG